MKLILTAILAISIIPKPNSVVENAAICTSDAQAAYALGGHLPTAYCLALLRVPTAGH